MPSSIHLAYWCPACCVTETRWSDWSGGCMCSLVVHSCTKCVCVYTCIYIVMILWLSQKCSLIIIVEEQKFFCGSSVTCTSKYFVQNPQTFFPLKGWGLIMRSIAFLDVLLWRWQPHPSFKAHLVEGGLACSIYTGMNTNGLPLETW